MTRDPQVDLNFSHFIPRYEATGVAPNDLRALMPRIAHGRSGVSCGRSRKVDWPRWNLIGGDAL
jgi:hypothetical protein